MAENHPKQKNWLSRGLAKFRLGQYEEALEDCSQALELDPKNASAYVIRGEAKGRLGQHKEALADVKKALEFGASGAETQAMCAVLYHQLGNIAQRDKYAALAHQKGSSFPWEMA